MSLVWFTLALKTNKKNPKKLLLLNFSKTGVLENKKFYYKRICAISPVTKDPILPSIVLISLKNV